MRKFQIIVNYKKIFVIKKMKHKLSHIGHNNSFYKAKNYYYGGENHKKSNQNYNSGFVGIFNPDFFICNLRFKNYS